jgi:hypothetical protein
VSTRLCVFAALVVAATLVGGAGAAEPSPGLVLVSAKTATATFAAVKGKGYQEASLSAIVRNESGRPVTLSLRYLGAGVPAAGRGSTPAKTVSKPNQAPSPNPTALPAAGEVTLVADAPLGAAPGETVRVAYQLRRRGTKPALDGVLVIAIAGAQRSPSLTVALADAKAPTAAVGFEQKQVTLAVTRKLGPLPGLCHWLAGLTHSSCPRQRLSGTSTVVAARGANGQKALLGAANGASVTVIAQPVVGRPATALPPRATVEVSDVTRVGKYSGQLAIDPTAKELKATDVTVDVQDSLIWPLLVILLGALVGGVLVKRYDGYRGGKLLRASIAETVEPYRIAKDNASDDEFARPQRFYLGATLPISGSPYPHFGRRGFWHSGAEAEVPALYRATRHLSRGAAVTALAIRVKALAERFGRWGQLDRGYRALVASLRASDLPEPGEGDLIRLDSDFLLDMTGVEPADAAEANALADMLVQQAAVIDVYRACEKEMPSEQWRLAHPAVDPKAIYAAQESPAKRSPTQWHLLRFELLRALRVLSHPETCNAYAAAVNEDAGAGEAMLRGVEIENFAFEREARELGRSVVLHFNSPAHLRSVVRRFDWGVFWLVAVLMALAYLLPFYVGKDYGSLTDYLGAFAAGAVVPTAINWALLPFARSDTVDALAASPPAVAAG